MPESRLATGAACALDEEEEEFSSHPQQRNWPSALHNSSFVLVQSLEAKLKYGHSHDGEQEASLVVVPQVTERLVFIKDGCPA